MPGLMEIRIGMDPDIVEFGGRVLTWHGFLTFLAVAMAVFIIARWARQEGISTDAVYSVAVWAIIGGIIGSRLLHVVDLWSEIYWPSPERIFYVWEGGITIYGAILGGFASGAAYMAIRNQPRFLSLWGKYFRWLGPPTTAPLPSIGRLSDIVAPGLLIAMIVGRLGDVINGEHFSDITSLPWGLVYTHSDTQQLYASNFLSATAPRHPAVVYEMFLDLAVLGVVWALRRRLRPDGMLFALYLGLYSVGRFFISFLRLDKDWLGPFNEAQVVAIIVLIVVVPLLAYKAQLVKPAPVLTARGQARPRR